MTVRLRPPRHGLVLGLVLTPVPVTDLALVIVTLPLIGVVLDHLIEVEERAQQATT